VTGGRKLARHDSGVEFARLTGAAPLGDIISSMEASSNFVSRCRIAVAWGHCDPAGIVFNARFFEYFDGATWTMFEHVLSVKPQDWPSVYGIFGIPLVDAGARFIAPARFGDVVELTSKVTAFRRSSFDVEHKLTVRGAIAVEGRETRVWAAYCPDDPTKIMAKPIPREVIARFQAA
jgi:4-hydroxybenzoyl-CoA thioesterase